MSECDCCGEHVDTDKDPVLCDECAEGVCGLIERIQDALRTPGGE